MAGVSIPALSITLIVLSSVVCDHDSFQVKDEVACTKFSFFVFFMDVLSIPVEMPNDAGSLNLALLQNHDFTHFIRTIL